MGAENIDLNEIKEAVDGVLGNLQEYHETVEKQNAEIKEHGEALGETKEKLAKMDKFFDKHEDLNQRFTKAIEQQKAAEEEAKEAAEAAAKATAKATEEKDAGTKEQIDRIETALKRTDRGGMGEQDSEAKEAKEAFFAACRRGVERLEPDEVKALTLADDTQAGILAPTDFVREIIKAEIVFSPIRTIARVRPTSNRSVTVTRRTGTFAAQWTAESGTRAETAGLKYGPEEIPTHEMYALVDISVQMLEDNVFNLEQELQEEFSEQFGVTEGTGLVSGTAVGQPEGFMTNGNVSEDVSGSAANLKDADGQADGLITLQHNLKEAYARNATWVLNRKSIGAVRKLKDNQKNYIWQPGNLATGIPNAILGDPYIEATDMDDEAANAFPVAYGDFRRAYTIVDRIQMSVLRDPFTQATSGNIRFIARKRVGGQVVLAEAIRKLKCST